MDPRQAYEVAAHAASEPGVVWPLTLLFGVAGNRLDRLLSRRGRAGLAAAIADIENRVREDRVVISLLEDIALLVPWSSGMAATFVATAVLTSTLPRRPLPVLLAFFTAGMCGWAIAAIVTIIRRVDRTARLATGDSSALDDLRSRLNPKP